MKADPKADAPAAAPGGKKKLIVIVLAAVLVAGGGGGGAAWFFLHGKKDEGAAPEKEHKAAAKKGAPPVFVPIDQFTVNLAPENGDQYLQVNFTLQVAGPEQEEFIKQNMPVVRSRLLLLLSSKKASELNTPEGKKTLATEIIKSVNEPFTDKGPEQEVTDVLFTSFIIQ